MLFRSKIAEKDLYKHTLIEDISFDLEQYKETGELVKSSSYLLVYFDPKKEKPEFFPL